MTDHIRKAVIYCRTATSGSSSLAKLDEQAVLCRRFAYERGLHVLGEFRDIGSGLEVGRDGLDRMIALIEREGDTVVIMEDATRIARGIAQHKEVKQAIEAAGGKIVQAAVAENPSSAPIPFGSQRPAVVYCRVSSVKQKTKGDGLESQLTRCAEFARMKNYAVVESFRDDVSGSLIDRPGMKAMLAYLRRNRAREVVVIIDDVSRLARDIKTHIELRSAISKAGGTLESPSIEFGEDSDSILVENLLASVSQHHRQKNGEQTKNRMRSRMLNGYAVFQAPYGYKYERVTGRGMMLKRQEPVASIIQEALEGFANDIFETQADVMRFLKEHPLFPKQKGGEIHPSRVSLIMNQPIYAGYIAAPEWEVPLRPAQHEGLISFEMYQRIQKKLRGAGVIAKRKNINADFPLRGFVVCDDCSSPLSACWSKGRSEHHPYYLCQKVGCDSYGKSIRRAKIEGDFVELLRSLTPSEELFGVVSAMFEDLWAARNKIARSQASALKGELAKIEKQVEQLLERIVESSIPSVIGAYEARVEKLEEEKLLLKEQIINAGRPVSNHDDILRTALNFVASPWKLWKSERLEQRRTVLKLTFADRLRYARNEGFRTASLSLPFNVLSSVFGAREGMVGPAGLEPAT